jgi:hypothetical protein
MCALWLAADFVVQENNLLKAATPERQAADYRYRHAD